MKQLLILSGKGGTGKTTVASAFIKLSKAKAFADCDVDAPNLHLLLEQPSKAQKTDFYGLPKAEINSEICISCGLCEEHCRFQAISNEESYRIDPYACEGCGVCEAICPVDAITLNPSVAGELILYKGEKVFSTAQLKMGSGNSGLLVTEVKKQMIKKAMEEEFAIIDGSPGIGCPVIASISGVDMVLIVTEPSISGISDMKRIIETAKGFQTKIGVCINKYDTNLENTEEITLLCQELNIPMVGKIPFDKKAINAVNQGKSIVDFPTISGKKVEEVYEKIMELI
jgi:MinD superfamily P-loop ATPase